MRALKTTTTLLISKLALAARSLPAWIGVPDYGGLASIAAQILAEVSRDQVRGLLDEVSRDVEHANMIFANNPNPERQRPDREESFKDLVAFRKGNYGGVADHLRRADERRRSIPEFAHLD